MRSNACFICTYWISSRKLRSLICNLNSVCEMPVWRFPLTANQGEVQPCESDSSVAAFVAEEWRIKFGQLSPVWSHLSERLCVCVCHCHQGWARVFSAHNAAAAFYFVFSHWGAVHVTLRCVSQHWVANSHMQPSRFCGFICECDSSPVPNLAAMFISYISHRITLLVSDFWATGFHHF